MIFENVGKSLDFSSVGCIIIMKTISIYFFVLGLAWGFFPNTVRYAFNKNGILVSTSQNVASQSIFCAAADDSIFMGFGSKYLEEKRNDVSLSRESDDVMAGSQTDPRDLNAGTIPVPELPAPSANSNTDDTYILKVDGPSVAMSELGPIIVNTDGTLRRIENWAQLTKAEQASTFRMVARRNKKRLEALKALQAEEEELQAVERAVRGDGEAGGAEEQLRGLQEKEGINRSSEL